MLVYWYVYDWKWWNLSTVSCGVSIIRSGLSSQGFSPFNCMSTHEELHLGFFSHLVLSSIFPSMPLPLFISHCLLIPLLSTGKSPDFCSSTRSCSSSVWVILVRGRHATGSWPTTWEDFSVCMCVSTWVCVWVYACVCNNKKIIRALLPVSHKAAAA